PFSLPEARHRSRGGAASDLDDFFGADAAGLADSKRAVHVGLGDRAAGIGLERELLELPDATRPASVSTRAGRLTRARSPRYSLSPASPGRRRSSRARRRRARP